MREFQSVIDELDEMQQKCRNVLNLTNDSLIAKAAELRRGNAQWQLKLGEQSYTGLKRRLGTTESLRYGFNILQETVTDILLASKKECPSPFKYHVSFENLNSFYQIIIFFYVAGDFLSILV